MTPWGRTQWLPPVMLLLSVPGCLMLIGPSMVTGAVGESLSVHCQYEEKFKENDKYWCREQLFKPCDKIVETRGLEREKAKGRVSLRDHPSQLNFTVTLRNLTVEDEGIYWCGIHVTWAKDGLLLFDPIFRVVVSVSPALTTASSSESSTRTLGPPTSLPAHTRPSTTGQETSELRSLLSSIHFLLLVFLKVPLLLSMLSAVLWVNRPLWGPRGKQCQPGSKSQ
ncbi:CMRF35-like molecule 6 [Loxodonta africana]|uniref:CMRF35-like molecule 6 n=1 Tax=Loxodonta africana TaxID=9785 RepID=UPI0030CAC5FE